MAKAVPQKTTDPARIRFVLVDAELPAGTDLGQIAHAIQNALRPAVAAAPPSRTPRALNGPSPNGKTVEKLEAEGDADGAVAESQETEAAEEATRNPRPRRKVTSKTPNVLDLHLTGNPSFVDFANQKNPKSQADRFLVIAAWLKDHCEIGAITPDHIYTCYRIAKWSTNISDFAAPLRSLKHRQLMGQTEAGYEINHLGLARVEDLGQG